MKSVESVVAEIEAMDPEVNPAGYGMAGHGVAVILFEAVTEDPILLVNELAAEMERTSCWLTKRPSPDPRIMGSLAHFCLVMAVMAANKRMGLEEVSTIEDVQRFWQDNGTNPTLPPV